VRTLAFCDPGLDRVSIAIFRHDTGPRQLWDLAPMQMKLERMTVVRAVTTSPRQDLPSRLLTIGQGVHQILTAEKVDRFYVEIPRVAGTYGRHTSAGYGGDGHGKFQADMQFTHYATGAIVCAGMTVLAGRLELVKALKGKKDQRLETVRTLLISVGRRAEVRNADDLDAVALGLGTTWPR
jgi:hypothetical protein